MTGGGEGEGHLLLESVVFMQKLCVHGPKWSWTAEKGNVSWCVWHTSRIRANWRILHTNILVMRRPCQHYYQTEFREKENKECKTFPPDVSKMSSMWRSQRLQTHSRHVRFKTWSVDMRVCFSASRGSASLSISPCSLNILSMAAFCCKSTQGTRDFISQSLIWMSTQRGHQRYG